MNKENIRYISILIASILCSSLLSVKAVNSYDSYNIPYDNSSSGLAATNVKDAVDELYPIANKVKSVKNNISFFNSIFSDYSSPINIIGNPLSFAGIDTEPFISDTGWKTLTLDSNFVHFANNPSKYAMKYRKKGPLVTVRGSFQMSPSSSYNGSTLSEVRVVTLPSGYRPDRELYFIQKSSGKTNFLATVKKNGEIRISRIANGASYANVNDEFWFSIELTFAV